MAETRPQKQKLAEQKLAKSNLRALTQLRAFLPFVWRYKIWLAFGLMALILTAAMSLVFPYLIGRIFDILASEGISLTPRNFVIALIVGVIMSIGAFMRVYFVQNLAHRVITDIRAAVFQNLIRLSRPFFDTVQSGEIVSRLAGDATVIGQVLTNNMSMAARQFLTFTGGLIMMLVTSPYLTGFVALIIPIILIPVAIISRRLIRYSRAAQDALARATSFAAESIQSIVTVQSYHQEARADAQYSGEVETHYHAHKRRILTLSIMVSGMILLMMGAVIFVLWLGAYQVKSGVMSGGALVQFLIYSMMVGGAAQSFADIWGELMRAVGAGERLAELLTSEVEIKEGKARLQERPGAVLLEARGLRFAYPGAIRKPAIQGISFELETASSLAIVGPSGAGKSTIFQLLLRHYDLDEGEIRLMGQPVQDLRFGDLRGQFAYVPQEAAIFATTIRENIAYSRPDASEEEIREAARAAFADEFIEKLPDGYESEVGERGVKLSGGQKARISLARAFLSDAPILLLDEATAALDAESEHFVQKALERLYEERSVIAIAHRLATIRRADRIIVVDEGKMVAQGTHEELIENSPLYARLARMQFLAD